MECCHQPGFLRKTKGTQHFYHQSKHPDCSWKDESPEHEYLKYQIYQICKTAGWDVSTEYRSQSGDWIADVFAEKDDRTIAFEVQLSKIPVAVLEDRDSKYRTQQIESYWILKDFLNCPVVNYLNGIFGKQSYPSLYSDFKNYPSLILKFENYFYVEKQICSIGINSPYTTLHTENEPALSLEQWVFSVLNGEYLKQLRYRGNLFIQNRSFMMNAMKIYENVYKLKNNLGYYKFRLDCWNRPGVSSKEFYSATLCYYTLEQLYGAIIEEGIGFFIFSGHVIDFNLISEKQLIKIEMLLENLYRKEKDFLECVLVLDKKTTNPPISKKIPDQQNTKTNKEIIHTPPKAKFHFNEILPKLTIESHYGRRYQNPAGCVWDIDKQDALEFEEKRLGKIIHKST